MHWIFAHLIGDYILQNDWMAYGKKESSVICGVHSFVYMLPFVFTGAAIWQLIVIALQHFAQDRTTFVNWFLRVSGKSDFGKPPMAPWSVIVVDNTFHVLFIALVFSI